MENQSTVTQKIDLFLEKYNERFNKLRRETPYYQQHPDLSILEKFDMEDIDNRQLPQSLKEEMLVDEQDETATKYVQQILKDFLKSEENRSLLKEEVFGNLLETKVYLSAHPSLNACIISKAIPPMIVVSKGCFLNTKGKRQPIDLLASVLGHELAHQIVKQYTTHKHSQTDEHACDTLGVLIANRAGYCPQPFKKHWLNEKDYSCLISRVSSSHPTSGIRASLLSTIIGALELKGYTVSKPTTQKYDSKDLRHIKNLKVNTVLENLLQAIQYNKLNKQDKKEAFIHITKYLLTQRPDIIEQEFILFNRLFKTFKPKEQEEITQAILPTPFPTFIYYDDQRKLTPMLYEVFGKTKTVQSEREKRNELQTNMRNLEIDTIIQYAKDIVDYKEKYTHPESETVGENLLGRIEELFKDKVHYSVKDSTILPWGDASFYFEAEYSKAIDSISKKEKFKLPWSHVLDYINNQENPAETREILQKMLTHFQLEKRIKNLEKAFILDNQQYLVDLVQKTRFLNPVTSLDALIQFEKRYLEQQKHPEINGKTEVSATYPYDFEKHSLHEIVQAYKDELLPLFTYNDQECQYKTKNHPEAELFLKQLVYLSKQNPEREPSFIQEFYQKELPEMIHNFFEEEQVYKAREKFYQATKKTCLPNILFSEKSPYIQFFKSEEANALSLSDKIGILAHTPLIKHNKFDFSKGDADLFNFDFLEVLNIKAPKTFEELHKLNEEIEKAVFCFKLYENDATYKQDVYRFCNFKLQIKNYINRCFLESLNLEEQKGKYIDLSKIGYYLSPFDETNSYDVNQTMSKIAEHNLKHLLSNDHNLSEMDEISFICKEYQKYNDQSSLNMTAHEAKKRAMDLAKDTYISQMVQKDLQEFEYFTSAEHLHYYPLADDHYHLNEMLENKIIHKISSQMKTASPDEQKKLYDLCYSILKDTPPQNPDFKDFLIKAVSTLHFNQIGLEKDAPSTEDFLNNINPDKYLEDFPTTIADDILCQIMAKAETQKELTYKIRDKIKTINNKKTDTYVQSIREALLYSHTNGLNVDILNFLKQPLTPQSTYKLSHLIEIKGKNTIYDSQDIPYFYKKLIQNMDTNGKNFITNSTKQTALANFHRQFWKSPPEAQALSMQYLLFNPDPKTEEKRKENKEFVKQYFNQIKKEISETADFSTYQNLAIDTYFENCENEETQALFISALYTMNPPQSVPYTGQLTKLPSKRKQRPGEVIKKILTQMGAAGGKTLQAIHSYPGTSEEIKADLKDSKSNFNPPKRYEIFESIEAAESFDDGKLKGQTAYVGKLLGSGSFGFTLKVQDEPNATEGHALTLLHPNALETANNQFKKFFFPVAKKLAKKNKKLFGALPSIIDQARHLTAIEADFLVGGAQTQTAEQQYKGIQVQAGNRNFNISAAHISDFGRRFKKTELAKGEHFNDLPTNTPEEIAYKKAVAQAIFTTELYTLLQMGPIDSDRHGAQVRVDGDNITLFDHGAIDFECKYMGKDKNGHTMLEKATPYIPTVSERRHLGKLIALALVKSKKGADFSSSLIDVLSKDSIGSSFSDTMEKFKNIFSKPKQTRPKISSTIQRALLALGDYIEAMGQTPEERSQTVQECLSSVMQHKEQLDDVLLISIGKNLPAHIRKELMNGTKTPSSVQFVDTAPYPKNQTPSFEKWIMRTFMPQFEASPKELPEIKKAVSLVKRIEEQEFTDQSEAKNSRLSAQLLSNYGQGGR